LPLLLKPNDTGKSEMLKAATESSATAPPAAKRSALRRFISDVILTRAEWLRELWHYRELLYFLVWRDIKVRYKQTVLGATWSILQPFLTMVVFTVFFRNLASMPSDGIPYPIFSYSALLPWTYFSGAITNAGNCLVQSSNLLTKVYFPRMAIPAASVLSGLVDFGIASLVLGALMVYFNFVPALTLLLWPLFLIPLVALALGVGFLLAALNVKFRDIRYALPFFVQMWLFVTPIIYPTSIIPERFRLLMALNPLGGIIDAFRSSMIPTREIDWNLLGISIAVSALILVIGTLYFRRTERFFADLI